jgi:CheY-like chemotaxis protein
VKRVLVVDDNAVNLYLLESILKTNNIIVDSAGNGAEARAAARRNLPDLIISDILMPVMDGFELCRRWKADDSLKHIPFIFYTATYTSPQDEQFALSLGADRFLIKPQKPLVLIQLFHELLDEFEGNKPACRAEPAGDEKEVLRQYNEVLFRKLEKKMLDMDKEIAVRRNAEERMNLSNRKLALMTDVTSQDIRNKVTALRGYIQLGNDPAHENERETYIEKELLILDSIQNVLQKTKDYVQMGLDHSRWIPLEPIIRMQMALQSQKGSVSLECNLHGLEIQTDTLINPVFYNLIHNSLLHGKKVTTITFSCQKTPDGAVLICEDDGIGIPAEQKISIFDRVAGGQGKFGLFFIREYLRLYRMTITETGTPGRGARFEIALPYGMFRFSESS